MWSLMSKAASAKSTSSISSKRGVGFDLALFLILNLGAAPFASKGAGFEFRTFRDRNE